MDTSRIDITLNDEDTVVVFSRNKLGGGGYFKVLSWLRPIETGYSTKIERFQFLSGSLYLNT
jgi:hypothetical protein